MGKVIHMDKVTESEKVVGRTFTVKAQRHQPFERGEIYEFDYDGKDAGWVLKCKCLAYIRKSNEYRFKIVEAEKQ